MASAPQWPPRAGVPRPPPLHPASTRRHRCWQTAEGSRAARRSRRDPAGADGRRPRSRGPSWCRHVIRPHAPPDLIASVASRAAQTSHEAAGRNAPRGRVTNGRSSPRAEARPADARPRLRRSASGRIARSPARPRRRERSAARRSRPSVARRRCGDGAAGPSKGADADRWPRARDSPSLMRPNGHARSRTARPAGADRVRAGRCAAPRRAC